MKKVSFHHTIEVLPFYHTEPVIQSNYTKNRVPLHEGSGRRLRRIPKYVHWFSRLKYMFLILFILVCMIGIMSI